MEEKEIIAYINAVGQDMLDKYIDQIFPPDVVVLGFYTAANATSWIDMPKFMAFVASEFQAKFSISSPMKSQASGPSRLPDSASGSSQASEVTVVESVARTQKSNDWKRKREGSDDSEPEIVEEQHNDRHGKRPAKKINMSKFPKELTPKELNSAPTRAIEVEETTTLIPHDMSNLASNLPFTRDDQLYSNLQLMLVASQ